MQSTRDLLHGAPGGAARADEKRAARVVPVLPGELPAFVQERFAEAWQQSPYEGPCGDVDIRVLAELFLHQGMLVGAGSLAQLAGVAPGDVPAMIHRFNATFFAGTCYLVHTYGSQGYALTKRER